MLPQAMRQRMSQTSSGEAKMVCQEPKNQRMPSLEISERTPSILLSATGHLFPSAFSRSLVPVIAFGVCLVSVTFGLVSGRLRSLADILDALSTGIAHGAPLIVIYLFAIQLFESFRFVFG